MIKDREFITKHIRDVEPKGIVSMAHGRIVRHYNLNRAE